MCTVTASRGILWTICRRLVVVVEVNESVSVATSKAERVQQRWGHLREGKRIEHVCATPPRLPKCRSQ